jgi:hypothetical protein
MRMHTLCSTNDIKSFVTVTVMKSMCIWTNIRMHYLRATSEGRCGFWRVGAVIVTHWSFTWNSLRQSIVFNCLALFAASQPMKQLIADWKPIPNPFHATVLKRIAVSVASLDTTRVGFLRQICTQLERYIPGYVVLLTLTPRGEDPLFASPFFTPKGQSSLMP